MERRTVALGVAAAGALAAAVLVAVAGHNSSPKHRAVAAYIKDVDLIQQRMRLQITQATSAYGVFSTKGSVDRTVEPKLARAARTLATLQLQFERLPAPPPAVRLRVLLVQLVGAEVSTAREIDDFARFSPRFSELLLQARVASAELSHRLAAVKPPKPHRIRGTKKAVARARAAFTAAATAAAVKQADALDLYVAALAAVERRLRKLAPPPVLAPAYRTELRVLERSRQSGAALAQELRKKQRTGVSVLGRRFTEASRIAGSVSVQRAQIAAIKAYNGRAQLIGTLQLRVRDELSRLQAQGG